MLCGIEHRITAEAASMDSERRANSGTCKLSSIMDGLADSGVSGLCACWNVACVRMTRHGNP